MEGTYTSVVRFDVRTVSLRQLAALWSTVMALVPEVRSSYAEFERHGQPTGHAYVYRDPDELASAGLGTGLGELRLRSVRVHGPDTSVGIHERPGTVFPSVFVGLPNALYVEIAGSNERDVLAIREAVDRWVAGHLATTRRALWLKLGALAAGIGAAWLIAVVMGFPANQAIGASGLWLSGIILVSSLQFAIPALRRRTIDLRIVNDAPPAGGGRRGDVSPAPEPEPGAAKDAGTERGTAHEQT